MTNPNEPFAFDFSKLDIYDSESLSRIAEAEGYLNEQEVSGDGKPMDLSDVRVPVELAFHILDGYSADECAGVPVWTSAWADSLRCLAGNLTYRCAVLEAMLDRLVPGWREEI